jgi:7,8-dihydropterin-6-yl-methyl-4-(beta-D-ribofuranosyl)aminobenzene 5'-phosphate synthase
MNHSKAILSIVYNNIARPGFKGFWGFGSVLDWKQKRYLFDTGMDADQLVFNMKKMNIDPNSIDEIILSHYHG